MKSYNKKNQREKRGQVTKDEIEDFIEYPSEKLIELLSDMNPKVRTIAAFVLGQRKIKEASIPLCAGLLQEKKLYPRIAFSEALGKIGKPSVKPLIKILGMVGKNQEKELPAMTSKKKSFPLTRDMAARTLIKIGEPAIIPLIKVAKKENSFRAQQAIDAMGGIAYKTQNELILNFFIERISEVKDDKITLWKIIRGLSACRSQRAITTLKKIVDTETEPALIREAERSISRINLEL